MGYPNFPFFHCLVGYPTYMLPLHIEQWDIPPLQPYLANGLGYYSMRLYDISKDRKYKQESFAVLSVFFEQ
jgi:hypothetical protein